MKKSPKSYPGSITGSNRIRITKNPSGERNLQVLGEQGKCITYYSERDIAREVSLFFEKNTIPGGRIIVLLGIGLGYHLKEIVNRKKRDQPVIVVESEKPIMDAALETCGVKDVFAKEEVFSVSGKNPEESLKDISRLQLQFGLRELGIIKHPPSVRAFPGFYRPIVQRLEAAKKAGIGNRLRYSKFERGNLNILLINSQYLLMGELINAAKTLGHNLKTIVLERDAEIAKNEFIQGLLNTIIDFRPDFVLTINHLGFDREGVVTGLLTSLEIPFASWYVDSPMLIIKHYRKNLSPYCAIFLWDEDYIPDMLALGFDKVHYLPLATDPEVFRPVNRKENPLCSWGNDVSFVGNSMIKKMEEKTRRLGIREGEIKDLENLGKAYAGSDMRNVGDILDREPFKNFPLVRRMQDGLRTDFEALVMWQATHIYRLGYVKMLEPFSPVIRGDKGWHSLLNGSFRIGPELSYYCDLNYFYNVSGINFNVTSTQMRNAVNQRVFDVPASGGFLLTDYKDQLQGLLDMDGEVVCYREREEIPELIRFYRHHGRAGEEIARRGRERVLKDHTYVRRLDDLCTQMRKHFQGEC